MAAEDRLQPGRGGGLFLDHVGYFVADHAAAAAALAALGFRATPWTVQVNPDAAGGPPVPTGTGNRCAMLRRGYLEVLARTADTPLARQFDAALARHAGIHLVAFASADAAAERARLAAAGFAVQPLVEMTRDTDAGTLAFSVARVEPGEMPEGRIQICTHHTPDLLWRPAWLDHPNGAEALTDQIVAVASVERAADRWERFLGRPAEPIQAGRLFRLERGRILLTDRGRAAAFAPGIDLPEAPCLPACAVGVADLAPVREALARGGLEPIEEAAGRLTVGLPPALGIGAIHFLTAAANPPWLTA